MTSPPRVSDDLAYALVRAPSGRVFVSAPRQLPLAPEVLEQTEESDWLVALPHVLCGDVVRHASSGRLGCVVEVGGRRRDGTTEYRVRPARDPELGVDLAWWNSVHVCRVPRRDPYRRYLFLVAAEDDLAGRGRRQRPEPERRQWRRRARSYGPWLSEHVWEKMYWRLCNLRRFDAGGEYVHYELGREHWHAASIDCLERRDRAARWWYMRPRTEIAEEHDGSEGSACPGPEDDTEVEVAEGPEATAASEASR